MSVSLTVSEEIKKEWLKCSMSCAYFLDTYAYIYDATEREWIPFRLWKEQLETLTTIVANTLVCILKARQLGLTWLVLGFALWLMLFHPEATVLLFSKRDDEAVHLLDDRMKGMYERLPEWMKAKAVVSDNDHEFALSNGSVARAFPTTAGDSYTASLAIVDEADLVPDLNRLMRAVKPTIDAGGRLILVSRTDKSSPESEFKRIYRAAKQQLTEWVAVFLPWWVRPERDEAWYQTQSADILYRTGSLDDLHEQYPATDTEAMAARTLDKRIAPAWIEKSYMEMRPHQGHIEDAPAIPGLEIYVLPEKGKRYVIGADPAEGNPTSDDSALTVLEQETLEEVAALAGKFQPSTFAGYIDAIGRWYDDADVMVERNNHGHAVLLWMRDNSSLRILNGHDHKPGWHSTTRGKVLLYDALADACREAETTIHSFATQVQIASIEGASLRAPDGQRDDRADSYALGVVGARWAKKPKKKARSYQG